MAMECSLKNAILGCSCLNPDTFDILGQVILCCVCGGVLCISGCLAVLLDSINQMPVALSHLCATKMSPDMAKFFETMTALEDLLSHWEDSSGYIDFTCFLPIVLCLNFFHSLGNIILCHSALILNSSNIQCTFHLLRNTFFPCGNQTPAVQSTPLVSRII